MAKIIQTHFKGGGCLQVPLPEHTPVAAAQTDFVPVERIDHRWYCRNVDDQGQEPICAAETAIEYQEVQNWKNIGHPKDYPFTDVLRAYSTAKKLDKNDNPGTTLTNAAKGMMRVTGHTNYDLQHLKGLKEICWGLHKFDVVMGAFMITDAWNLVDADTGFIDPRSTAGIGGHGVLICAYDLIEKWVGFKNWWGEEWGWCEGRLKGFGRMTVDQFNEQCFDAIVLKPN